MISRREALGPLLAMVLTLPVALTAWAAGPTEQLRSGLKRVLHALEDTDLSTEARASERRATIRQAARELFDFAEMTKRSLGQHWNGRTAEQREELVKLFSELLERMYLSKIEVYSGETVVFAGESVDGDQAVVRTRIQTRQGSEIPVDYRLVQRGELWLAYDVVIEGVSLVSNYRSQFNKILQSGGSYSELVKRLRARLEEQLAAPGPQAKRASN